MMKMISNSIGLVTILAASIAMTSCAYSKEYYALSHCWESARTLEDMLANVDSIALVSVGDIEELEGYEWQKASLVILEQIKGKTPISLSHPVKIVSADDPKFYEFVSKTLNRAQAHSSPQFLAGDVRNFPSFSDISQVDRSVKRGGGTAPIPVDGSCKRAPYLLKGVNYLVLLKGEKIVSVEPVLDESDYWLGFVRALGENNYWPIYRDE